MSLRVRAFGIILLLLAVPLSAGPPGAADLSGEWILTISFYGNPLAYRMQLNAEGGKLAGSVSRGKPTPITAAVEGDRVRFEWKDPWGTLNQLDGRLEKGELSGTASFSGDAPGLTPPMPWRARRAATNKPAAPRTLDFEPKEFHRVFSSTIEPVLRVWPGDTVRTWTVDAGGVDAKGQTRTIGGNPQTGPFYVEGAMPGDLLVVHVKTLKLNRPSAVSDDGLVSRAITSDWASEHKQEWNDVAWSLDLQTGMAKLAKPTERLAHLAVPTRPMLGCVGVAPGYSRPAMGTGDNGRIGGNMDFNEIVEGSTVYLPVGQPGALLYVGDGHAIQGDGELNGNALETSMDVEFSVDVVRAKSIPGPRVENAEYIMAMGLEGSLDDAFKEATSALADWLESDYGLTGPEVAMLLGVTVEYEVSEVADRNAGIVAKIPKKYLPKPKP
jgi:acetamidase/formamidase